MNSVHSALFEEALRSDDPTEKLYRLAVSLRDEGVTQTDAMADNMDLIHGGPWAKGRDLFETPLFE